MKSTKMKNKTQDNKQSVDIDELVDKKQKTNHINQQTMHRLQ